MISDMERNAGMFSGMPSTGTCATIIRAFE